MSGRFFRGGRALFQSALQPTRGRRNVLTSATVRPQLTLTFTSPSAMLANALTAGQSAVVGSATGGVRTTTTQASGGARGCGNVSCCQTAATSLTLGEDGEEPFIGGPSLSSNATYYSTQNQNKTDNNNNHQNTTTTTTGTCSTAKDASPSATSSPTSTATPSEPAAAASPPPRVKCDPYEQGGNPLAASVVREHMAMTLDPAWAYDEEKKMLSRVYEFGRLYSSRRSDSTERLFAFLADIGHIQQSNSHPVYNFNVNLRANAVQVVLRTIALRGISYQDLMLATKLDGIWFREGWRKEQKEREERQREKQAMQQMQQQQQQQASKPPSTPSSAPRPTQPTL